MQLLELPYYDLRDFLEKASQENPFLAYEYADDDAVLPLYPSQQRSSSNAAQEFADPATFFGCQDPLESLQEALRLQMLSASASSAVIMAGLYIIQHIDPRGYCSIPLSEMAENSNFSEGTLNQALELIQTFSPKGVGAFSLCECLKLQVDTARPDYDKILELLSLPQETLERRNLKELARCCGVASTTVQHILQYLATLNPAPGLAYLPPEPVNYIFPEIVIMSQDNEVELWLHDGTRLVVLDESYFHELSGRDDLDTDTSEFISVKFQEAKALVDGLILRQKALEKLMKFLLVFQHDYFLNPSGRLRPLTMRQAAQELNMNPSTITRCVNDKYIQTKSGVVPLRSLFSSGLPSGSDQTVSPDTIKRLLYNEIHAEPSNHPLDDASLAARLTASGITISRRTVAKYRQQMGIPGSKERVKKG